MILAPDAEGPPPSLRDMSLALEVQGEWGENLGKQFFIVPVLCFIQPSLVLTLLSHFVKVGSFRHRFDKVATGEWQFVDEPRPPPKKVKEESFDMDAAPSFG